MIDKSSYSPYIPTQAIVIYKQEGGNNFYLESQPMETIQGKTVMGAASPLKKETILEMASYFYRETQVQFFCKKLLPASLLYIDNKAGSQTLVWYKKPENRHLYFKEGLGVPNGNAWLPGLIFVAKGVQLFVFATKSKQIGVQTKLFKAPFLNINSNSSVCMGNVKIEGVTGVEYADAIKTWERLFFTSEFSHINGNSSPTKSNTYLLWKHLVETQERFPGRELLPDSLYGKLDNLLSHL